MELFYAQIQLKLLSKTLQSNFRGENEMKDLQHMYLLVKPLKLKK